MSDDEWPTFGSWFGAQYGTAPGAPATLPELRGEAARLEEEAARARRIADARAIYEERHTAALRAYCAAGEIGPSRRRLYPTLAHATRAGVRLVEVPAADEPDDVSRLRRALDDALTEIDGLRRELAAVRDEAERRR